MIVINNKKQQKIFEKLGYNPNKRIQIISKYSETKHYISNIKEQFKLLFTSITTLIVIPFCVIYQFLNTILSFNYWCLIYTKKNLEEGCNVVEATFKKPKDI